MALLVNQDYSSIYLQEKAKMRKEREEMMLRHLKKHIVKKVIFNDPKTIVIWFNGDKTIVTCQEGDHYDKEKGFALCFMKWFFNNSSRDLNDVLHLYVGGNHDD